jgi:hypothetical protein
MTKKNENAAYTKNTLTRIQGIRLYEWLKANKRRIEEEKLTIPKAARQAGAELGFQVSEGNVSGLAKELGIAWWITAQRQRSGSLLRRVEELEAWRDGHQIWCKKLYAYLCEIDERVLALGGLGVLVNGQPRTAQHTPGSAPPSGSTPARGPG